MKDGLYHKDIGLPVTMASEFVGQIVLSLSLHAKQAARSDRYGKIDIQSGDSLEVTLHDVIEVEVRDGVPVKAVVRQVYDDNRDIVLAINRVERGVALVRTVWFNVASDKHKSLDHSKYIKP